MSYLSRELADVIRLDRTTEIALDLDQERRDHRADKHDRDLRDIHTCHDHCPCHHGGDPLPDFEEEDDA